MHRNAVLWKRKEAAVSSGVDVLHRTFVAHAFGAQITDIDGHKYIDFSGGIGATNIGHGNPALIHAIEKQTKKFVHTCFTAIGYENYIALCERLNKLITTGTRNKSALFTSGAEAVENAVKIARRATGRSAVVSFEHGFHGRTLLTMSLTSKSKPYKQGFGPFAPETYKLEYPYLYRKPAFCESDDDYVDYLLGHIEEDFFKGVVAPEQIACVVMELVTGEGGFIVAPKRYVHGLWKICRREGILFVVDEVQTGFGRTGKMFAFEHYGIRPDIVTMAKSLSNGLPLSAVTGKANIMDSVQLGGLGGTFGGNPVSCAAALAALDFLKKNRLPRRAQKIGRIVMKRFTEMQRDIEQVGDARGLGAMCALEIVHDKKSKKPDEEMTKKIAHEALRRGLLLLYAGILGNDLRTLMPLIIHFDELERGLAILEESVRTVVG